LINAKPGTYHYAFEFEDEKSGKRSRIHQDIQVQGFRNDQFQMSDILLAIDVKPPNLNVMPARSDFQITPNPLKIYRRGEPVVIYYELYQLNQDISGETRFRIEYQIGSDIESFSSVKRFLTNVGIIKKTGEVTSGYEYSGKTQNELQYQKILLDKNMMGKIKLVLKATDILTGTSLQKEASFTVTE
jgi:hypothetical protein